MEKETENIIKNKCGPNFGDMTPIMTDSLPILAGTTVCISEVVAKKMMELAKKTHKNDSEYTFVLVGMTRGTWTLIKGIHEDNPEEKIQRRRAEHSQSEVYYIDCIARGNGGEWDSVFICHTHPDKGQWYSNFSLGDIDAMIKNYKNNPQFRNANIAYGMLTGDNKFIAAFYDPEYKSIYRFHNILVNRGKKNIATWKDFVRLGRMPDGDDAR